MTKKIIKNLIYSLFVLILIVSFSSVAEAQNYYSNTNQYTSNTMSSSVTLNSSLNPGGQTTTAWFEYSTDPKFQTWNETEHEYVGSSYQESPFGAMINNLMPNTVYYFRVVTNNGKNTTKGNILSFNTNTQNNNISYNNSNFVNTNSNTTNTRYISGYNYGQPIAYSNTYPTNYQNTNRTYNSNVANPLFSTSFLPNTLGAWLILILLIFAIIVIVRKLFKTTYIIHK